MTGSSIAQILTSLATLVGVVGGIIVQLRGQNESRSARADLSDKIDTTAAKIDTNTALTQATVQKVEENTVMAKDTAAKVDDVHSTLIEATGNHKALL